MFIFTHLLFFLLSLFLCFSLQFSHSLLLDNSRSSGQLHPCNFFFLKQKENKKSKLPLSILSTLSLDLFKIAKEEPGNPLPFLCSLQFTAAVVSPLKLQETLFQKLSFPFLFYFSSTGQQKVHFNFFCKHERKCSPFISPENPLFSPLGYNRKRILSFLSRPVAQK